MRLRSCNLFSPVFSLALAASALLTGTLAGAGQAADEKLTEKRKIDAYEA